MKQTAVELLKQRLIKDQQVFPIYNEYINGILYDINNELLEMEKQQQGYSAEDLKNAYLDGCEIKLTNTYHLNKWFEKFKNK